LGYRLDDRLESYDSVSSAIDSLLELIEQNIKDSKYNRPRLCGSDGLIQSISPVQPGTA